jgi:4,5-dihydroxyphthalate decarboxylase
MLRINLACWDYDRTRPIYDGRVRIEGMEVNYIPLWVEETFSRMLRNKEFEVSEMSLSAYISSLFTKEPPFVAIPVFPSRTFRHRSIFVNKNSGINVPSDLKGKRVGVYRFRHTASVWIRGILADNYDLPLNSVSYYSGGLERPEVDESKFWGLPSTGERMSKSGIRIQQIGENKILSTMLENGDIDALYTARMPSSFTSGSKNVAHLFPDYVQAEMDYFKKTRIFPIMHTIVIRKDVYEKNRWMAISLLKGFIEAKELAYKALYQTGALRYMLPWMSWEVEESRKLMGKDYWSYGFKSNYETLKTFLRYSYEQNLSDRELEPEDVFAEETIDPYIKDELAPTL